MGVLDGYLHWLADEPVVLVDGRSYLDRPEFWASHLLRQGVVEPDLVEQALTPESVASEFHRSRLSDFANWPYFVVDTPRLRMFVVYRNFREDMGVDYLISDRNESRWIQICALDGHQQGPGLSWAELARIAADGSEAGSVGWARRLLLVMPIVSDTEPAPDAVDLVTEALEAVGASVGARALAAALVEDNHMWEPTMWTTTAGLLVARGAQYAPRDPESPFALPEGDLAFVSQLLNP